MGELYATLSLTNKTKWHEKGIGDWRLELVFGSGQFYFYVEFLCNSDKNLEQAYICR